LGEDKRLIDIMTKNKMEELSNKEEAELKKIEENEKSAEENLRKVFKHQKYSSLWLEDGKNAVFTGIGAVALWIIFLASGGTLGLKEAIINVIVGALVGGALALRPSRPSDILLGGVFIGSILGMILPFINRIIFPSIISLLFLIFLSIVLAKVVTINEEASQIELGEDEKKKFEQKKLYIRNKIKKEMEDCKKEIVDKVFEMDEDTIDKFLESLLKP
jgi:hypothetical protein